MTTPLKVGLLGFGYAAATFHAPLVAAVPGLELAAVFSSRPADVQAAWPGVVVCESAASVIARSEMDVVVIATPNDTHAALAAQALAAGKHVVVDKPFTLTVREAQDLIGLAARHRRVLSVFHNRRWDADFLTLRRIVGSGVLGRIVQVESHFDRFRPQVRARWRESGSPGSGLWYDLGPHLLDQTLQLFGAPQTLWLDQARQRDGSQADDWFHAVLRYGGSGGDAGDDSDDRVGGAGLRVVLHASALTAQVAPRFVVHGTRGSLSKLGLDTQEDALKAGLRPPRADWGVDPQPMQLSLVDTNGVDAQQLVHSEQVCVPGDYAQFYAGVRDAVLHGTPNPVPPQQALQVMELIALGQQSAREGRVLPVAHFT